jgi:hypothetical protein
MGMPVIAEAVSLCRSLSLSLRKTPRIASSPLISAAARSSMLA